MNYDSNALALFAFLGVFIFIFAIIGLVFYILMSLGLYKMAQNAGIENPWLAWIPIANLYILGKLVKTASIGSLEIPSLEIILPVGSIAVAVLSGVPLIGWILSIAFAVLYYVVLYRLFSMYRSEKATLWLVLSIIFAFMPPIFIFMMRNDRAAA